MGHHLVKLLKDSGYEVIIFTRDMHKVSRVEHVKYSYWSPNDKKFDVSYMRRLDAVVNLAGASVEKRWTKKQKQEIVKSRVDSTGFLIGCLKEHAPQCKTIISASAIGYYGPDRDGREPFHEDAPPAEDFLANTCKLWEEASHKAQEQMRTVILRFGIVLGEDDGAFPQLSKPQNFGIVPILGNGKQVMSWIHIQDLCRIIAWALHTDELKGTFNAVAPHPISYKQLMKTIARKKGGIKLPIYIPDFALKVGLGEMASEVLKSTTVSADKIQQAGFEFKYPTVENAVANILQKG